MTPTRLSLSLKCGISIERRRLPRPQTCVRGCKNLAWPMTRDRSLGQYEPTQQGQHEGAGDEERTNRQSNDQRQRAEESDRDLNAKPSVASSRRDGGTDGFREYDRGDEPCYLCRT